MPDTIAPPTIRTTIKIKIQGPMPDTDREPGIWVADVMVSDAKNITDSYRLNEQSWKADDLDKMIQSLPEIIQSLCQPKHQ